MALQCYDPTAGVGIIARADRTPNGTGVGGRVLLFSGQRDVALFTGDDPHTMQLSGGGPHFSRDGAHMRLQFDGMALRCDDGRRYVDLEDAFAASHLLGVSLDLAFTAGATPDYGGVHGTLELGGVAHRIDTLGFSRPAVLRRGPATGWQSLLTLDAAFSESVALHLHHRLPGGGTLQGLNGDARQVTALQVLFESDAQTPQRILVEDRGVTTIAEPLARMAIARPLGHGRFVRHTFGVARVAHGATQGYGFYEYARVLPTRR